MKFYQQVGYTPTLTNTLSPEWNSTFLFHSENMQKGVTYVLPLSFVTFRMYDNDTQDFYDLLGQASVKLRDLQNGERSRKNPIPFYCNIPFHFESQQETPFLFNCNRLSRIKRDQKIVMKEHAHPSLSFFGKKSIPKKLPLDTGLFSFHRAHQNAPPLSLGVWFDQWMTLYSADRSSVMPGKLHVRIRMTLIDSYLGIRSQLFRLLGPWIDDVDAVFFFLK